jgi:hypothetical protein
VSHVDQVDPETAEAMREHIRDVDRSDADWVDEMTDAEILDIMDCTYEGGSAGFTQERAASEYDREIANMLPPGTHYAA